MRPKSLNDRAEARFLEAVALCATDPHITKNAMYGPPGAGIIPMYAPVY